MTFQQRQSHLIEQITQLKDEQILILLEHDLVNLLQEKNEIHLSEFDLKELIVLADEPGEKDTVTDIEYKQATDKWRIK
jgi:tRNA(Met) C34 N-acetyltransferase TmcA